MSWFKKKKPPQPPQVPVKLDREAAKAEALANARLARAAIGEENLQRLAHLLGGVDMKQQAMKAREQIRKMDHGKVADNVRLMLNDDD